MKDKPKRAVRIAKGGWGPWQSNDQERYARFACERLSRAPQLEEYEDRWGFVKALIGRLFPFLCYKNRRDGLRIVFRYDEETLFVASAADRARVYENENAELAACMLRRKGRK